MLQKLLKRLTLRAKFQVSVSFVIVILFIGIGGFIYLNSIDELKTEIRNVFESTQRLDSFLLEVKYDIHYLRVDGNFSEGGEVDALEQIQPLIASLSGVQFQANELEAQFSKVKNSALALLLLPYNKIADISTKVEEIVKKSKKIEEIQWKYLKEEQNIAFFLLSLEGSISRLESASVAELQTLLNLLVGLLGIVLGNVNIVLFTSIILFGVLAVVSVIVLLAYVRNNIFRFIRIIEELNKAEGDLTLTVPEDSEDTLGMLGKGFNTFVAKIKDLMGNLKSEITRVQDSSHSILQVATISSTNVNNILKETEDIEKNTEAQTSNVLHTVAAIKEIVNLMKAIADSVDDQRTVISTTSYTAKYMVKQFQNLASKSKKVHEAANQLLRLAKNGGKAVTKTVQSINEIQEDSVKINEIVNIISAISEQTNLLAMNAAIEAAHAKEYGKGFAVVADEVRKLAEHSGDASNEIVELIKGTVEKVQVSVGLSDNSYSALQTILEETASTTSFINEISTGIDETKEETDEILDFIDELNLSSERVRQNTELGREKAESIINAVNEVQEYADNITQSLQEQLISSKAIVKNVDNLSDYSRINEKVVTKLKELSDLFKTDESVEIDAYDSSFLIGGNGKEIDPDRPRV